MKLEQRSGRGEVKGVNGPYRSFVGHGFDAKRAGKTLKGFEHRSDPLAAALDTNQGVSTSAL